MSATPRKNSGGAATAAARMRRMRARHKQQGLREIPVIVPSDRVDEIKQIAATMRQESTMEAVLNKLRIAFPDGQFNDIELGDVALPGDDSQAALAALETLFPDAEIKMEGKRFWIEEEDVEATLYRDDD